MRRLLGPGLVVIGIVSLAAGPAASDDPRGLHERHPWHGWSVGTWAESRETVTAGTETKTSQAKSVLQDRETGVGIDLRKYPMKDGKYDETAKIFEYPRRGVDPAVDPQGKLLGKRTGKLTIDGKEVECEIREYSVSTDKDKPDARVELWHQKGAKLPVRRLEVDEAPHIHMGPDVVRAELVFKSKEVNETSKMAVVSLKDSRKIGGKDYACIREEGEGVIEYPEGAGRAKITRWVSDEVPGRVISTAMEGEKGETGKPPVKFKAIEEVIAFGVPKK